MEWVIFSRPRLLCKLCGPTRPFLSKLVDKLSADLYSVLALLDDDVALFPSSNAGHNTSEVSSMLQHILNCKLLNKPTSISKPPWVHFLTTGNEVQCWGTMSIQHHTPSNLGQNEGQFCSKQAFQQQHCFSQRR